MWHLTGCVQVATRCAIRLIFIAFRRIIHFRFHSYMLVMCSPSFKKKMNHHHHHCMIMFWLCLVINSGCVQCVDKWLNGYREGTNEQNHECKWQTYLFPLSMQRRQQQGQWHRSPSCLLFSLFLVKTTFLSLLFPPSVSTCPPLSQCSRRTVVDGISVTFFHPGFLSR